MKNKNDKPGSKDDKAKAEDKSVPTWPFVTFFLNWRMTADLYHKDDQILLYKAKNGSKQKTIL